MKKTIDKVLEEISEVLGDSFIAEVTVRKGKKKLVRVHHAKK